MPSRAPELFQRCVAAIQGGILIERASRQDKEFALQDWVEARIEELDVPFIKSGRNSYPDFPLRDEPEGFEVKGLFTHTPEGRPGRLRDYDANSNIPTGTHDGRTINYVFARYPQSDGDEYPVHDLVICHGDFLNPMRDYVHENRSFRTFGAYGDIMIRDRKMYVVRTPYSLASGLIGERTLIVPAGDPVINGLVEVGVFSRFEADTIPIGYQFDLRTNELTTLDEPNPTAGKEHKFAAYRVVGDAGRPVTLA